MVMHFPSIFDLRDEFELLTTGETEILTQRQDEFYRLFSQIDEELDDLEAVWEYDTDTFDVNEAKQLFFDKVGEIHSIPPYKYILKYLFLHYRLAINKEYETGFWNYLENDTWTIGRKISADEVMSFREKLIRAYEENISLYMDEDYQMLLSVLVYYLQIEYQCNGIKREIKWTKYLKKMLFHFEVKYLNELALALHMEYPIYRVFRKKVLKHSEMNFYDRESIFLYLVLKYGNVCGMYRFFDAYQMLNELYPEKNTIENDVLPDTTKQIGQWFVDYLEEEGNLKEKYHKTLFTKWDEQLAGTLAMVDAVTRNNSKRSAQKVFAEQWMQLESFINKYEKERIFERILMDKMHDKGNVQLEHKRKYESELSYVGRQKIYEWLYGTNVITRVENRNIERKDHEMILLGNGQKEYFLNSKTFLETRIRDNTFSAFPLDEKRQRNLIMTLAFLNFVLESQTGGYLAESYQDRLADFEIFIFELFVPCGFALLHSGNDYDAFIKLLLSCDEPIELFKYIWRQKTGSEE